MASDPGQADSAHDPFHLLSPDEPRIRCRYPRSGGGPIESQSQLAEYLAAGCKPKSDWRIGTEHEKFGYCKDTLLPLPYDGPRSIRAMLEGLRDRFGWTPILEGPGTSSAWSRMAPTCRWSRAGNWS